MRMSVLVLVVLLIACRRDERAAPAKVTADPWDVAPKPDPDALPTFAERHAFARKTCPKVDKPYFFAVTKNHKTSHILGTRHLGVGLDQFPAVVTEHLDAASLAVFEIAPDDDGKPSFAAEPLRDELGPKDWAHFEKLMGKATATRFVNQAPAVAGLTLMTMYEDIGVALDKQIQDRVRAHDIPARGLETSEFQFRVLASLIDLKLVRAVIEDTTDRAKIEKSCRVGLERYCAGDDHDPELVDGVDDAKMLEHGYTKADLEALFDTLLYRRNADWIPKLEKLFEQDKVFVAVGAGHLQGPRGVIALLEKRGFKVERIAEKK